MKTAVLLMGHGSRIAEANDALRVIAGLVKQQSGCEIVEVAFREMHEPDIQRGIDACVAQGADRIVLYPCNTTEDIVNDPHLRARNVWNEVEHPELGVSLPYPRPCVRFSDASCEIRRCAPLIGERNEEIYLYELGLSRDELVLLKEKGIV